MNDMAKVIRSGGGQSVELPEGYRFEGEEVRIHREGERIVLEPADLELDPETGLTIRELRALVTEAEDESGDAEWDTQTMLREFRAEFDASRRM
ncbi:virulence-associated protein VagC [Sphingomonas jinjuensis]|uniref:Virulence-associated protein VagC n=1 Tax=Sphingomonas jinjuensis TaxID=535907 RepID=A0A840F3A8_9SPHN|nr:hypothetical protein [Sphingomonas jinjuensis]MBB4153823.1 virulence-associated protein VagC [Sphingomonas jinjuensis]